MYSRHPPYILTGLHVISAVAIIPLCVSVLNEAKQSLETATAAFGIVTAAVTLIWHCSLLGMYLAYRITNRKRRDSSGERRPERLEGQQAGGTFFNTSEENLQNSWSTNFSFCFFPSIPILVVFLFVWSLQVVLIALSAVAHASKTQDGAPSDGSGVVSAITYVAIVGVALVTAIIGWGCWKLFRKDRSSRHEASLPDELKSTHRPRRASQDSEEIQWGT